MPYYFIKRTLAFCLFMLIFSSMAVYAQHPLLGVVQRAFQDKDAAVLQDYLSSSFSVSGSTHEGAAFKLRQILTNYPVESIREVGRKKVAKGILYDVETTRDGKARLSSLLVDADGKLIYSTLFDELYGMSREPKSRLLADIPFENHNGSIILTVFINELQRPIRLLFDTGADGMAVSESLAAEIGLKVTRENNASVVGGNTKINVSENNTVLLDNIQLTGMGIAIFPEMKKDHAEGIIGNTLLYRYLTKIDYDRNILSLYSFGDYTYEGKGQRIPITLPSGLLLVPGQLDIVKGQRAIGTFVFDTGASYDLICFRPFVRQHKLLVSGFKPEIQASTVSMGISSPTFLGASHQFEIAALPPMPALPVTLMGGTSHNENWNPGADGSIGVRMLSRYNLTINLAEGELFFSPNRLHRYPQDFIVKGCQFGWNNQGELFVISSGLDAQGVSLLAVGVQVLNIGGFKADVIKSKGNLIKEIQGMAKDGNAVPVVLEGQATVSL